MNILMGLLGGQSYIDIVKVYIKKLFVHEAKKFHCNESDLKIIINYETDGTMSIMTYSVKENRVWRIIPDDEAQKILMQ